MALTELINMSVEEIDEAFQNAGMYEMNFTQVKFKCSNLIEGQLAKLQFQYNGLWFDEEEQKEAINVIYVWLDPESGRIVADCDGCPKYINDFL